jgi:RNA polymerase sigma-70 factor (ECF subfamily)
MQTQERTGVQPYTSVDGVLIQQALAGDEHAFEGLVRRYQGPLFQYIYHFVGDYDLACDVFQQVLLQLYRSLPTLCTIQPLKPWLLRVAHNGCVSELRRKRLTHFSELEAVDEEEDSYPLVELADREPLPEEVAERHDLQQRLQQAIVALPPKIRAVVVLRYAAHLGFAEIGQTLGIPLSTAKARFQRAKPLLRASLIGRI